MGKKKRKAAYARVYLGVVNRLPRERQLEICTEGVKRLDGVELLDAIYDAAEFDRFILDLRRRDEIAALARLTALAQQTPEERRSGVAFFDRLLRLRDHACYILDAETGIRSIDGDTWYQHVIDTANKIMRGQPLPTERAIELGSMAKKDRAPGLVDEWKSPARAADRERVGQHWRDPAIKNAKEAIRTIPEPYDELRTVSRRTMERIFGGRTVSKKRKA